MLAAGRQRGMAPAHVTVEAVVTGLLKPRPVAPGDVSGTRDVRRSQKGMGLRSGGTRLCDPRTTLSWGVDFRFPGSIIDYLIAFSLRCRQAGRGMKRTAVRDLRGRAVQVGQDFRAMRMLGAVRSRSAAGSRERALASPSSTCERQPVPGRGD